MNRGGAGWQEPPKRREPMRPMTLDDMAALQALAQAGALDPSFVDNYAFGVANGQAPRPMPQPGPKKGAPVDAIDMIEVNGVWMTLADAQSARARISGPA